MSTAAGTTTTIASITLADGLLGIVTIVSLLIVVLIKETGGGSRVDPSTPAAQLLSRSLNAPILAWLVVFGVVVTVRMWEVLP